MEVAADEEEIRELDMDKDLFVEDAGDAAPVSQEELQSNSRFLTEEAPSGRGPRFSNPTIERLNSFRYRKTSPKAASKPEVIDEPIDPRSLYQTSYDTVETRQRTAVPQVSIRRAAASRSSEQLVARNAKPFPSNGSGSNDAPRQNGANKHHVAAAATASASPARESTVSKTEHVTDAPRQNGANKHHVTAAATASAPPARESTVAKAESVTSPAPVAEPTDKKTPATDFIPTRTPRAGSRSRNASRSTTPTPDGSARPVKIPFANSSRVAASIELMSPIRQRNALEALAASITAHADDPQPESSPVSSRATTPTALRRAKAEEVPAKSNTGGWNASVKVAYPTPNEIAIAHIQAIKMDSGEKPLPPRSAFRSFTPTRGRSVASGDGSRSGTPSTLSGASAQRGRSPGRTNRAATSMLSPYNMMVSDRVLDAAQLTENDLKTLGKQLLLLKLLLEDKMAAEAERDEADLMTAWQAVYDAEEHARTLAGQDNSVDEITTLHQQVSEMEQMMDRVTDHLAPVFERLSTYIKLKEDEDRAANGEGSNGDNAIYESKVQTHRELQARVAMLSKCVAVMKKNVENPELAVVPKSSGQVAGADRATRRLSLNSHVTASAAARRAEDKAAHERALAAAQAAKQNASPPVQSKPKPARHSMGNTPSRSTSPSAVSMTRRLSLNSHVTASAAARRAEDKAVHEKALAEVTHTKVTPKRFHTVPDEPKPAQAARTPPPTDGQGRRLSLNSNVTASAAARRAEDKAAHEKAAAEATHTKVTPKVRHSTGGAGPPLPRVALLSPKPRESAEGTPDATMGKRRLSLNSHLTASQMARREEVKKEHLSPKQETTAKPVPPRSKSPNATVNRSPFSGATYTQSHESAADAESGDESRGAGSGSETHQMKRRVSLNSHLTASQLARRAEVKEKIEATKANSPPKAAVRARSPHAAVTHPAPFSKADKSPTRESADSGAEESAEAMQRRLSLNSNLTASQKARRAEVQAEHQAVLATAHGTRTPGHTPKASSTAKHAAPASQTSPKTRESIENTTTTTSTTESAAELKRRLSLNSHLTASQQARRAEVKAEHRAVRTPVHHTPKTSSPSPHGRDRRFFPDGKDEGTNSAGDKARKDFVKVGDLSLMEPLHSASGDSNDSSVVRVTTPSEIFDDIRSVAERQSTLKAIFNAVDDDEDVPVGVLAGEDVVAEVAQAAEAASEAAEAVAETADADAPAAEEATSTGAVAVVETSTTAKQEGAAVAVEEAQPAAVAVEVEAAAEPTPVPAPEPTSEPVAVATVEAAPAVSESAVMPPPAPPATIDEHLDSMFEVKALHSEDEGELPVPVPPAVAATAAPAAAAPAPETPAPSPAAPVEDAPATSTTAAAADMRSPERKARSEAFERLMRRMNTNKEGAKESPADSPVPRAEPATTAAPAAVAADVAQNAPEAQAIEVETTTHAAVPTTTTSTYGDVVPLTEATAASVDGTATTASSAAAPEPAAAVPITEAATANSPSTAASAAAAAATEQEAPKGVSALMSKFGQKASAAPRIDTTRTDSTASAPSSPLPSDVGPPKREKSTRVSELMNKFNNAGKKETTSPVPTPTHGAVRSPVRASVTALGDINPIKAVFEKDTEAAAAVSSSDTAQQAPAVTAFEPAVAAVEPVAPAPVPATTAPEPVHVEQEIIPTPVQEPAPMEVVMESTQDTAAPAVSVEEPESSAAAVADPAVESTVEPAEEPLAGAVVHEEQAVDYMPYAEDSTKLSGNSASAASVDEEPPVSTSASAPAATVEVKETPGAASSSTTATAPLSPAPQPQQAAAATPDPSTAMETASDAGSEQSAPNSTKKRRPTLKGLWKRVKSATGSSKDTPFETEGWKPSPMVPEDNEMDTYDQVNFSRAGAAPAEDQGADWSSPGVFDSPQHSGKSGQADDTASTGSGAKHRRPTLKGLWKMVKASNKDPKA